MDLLMQLSTIKSIGKTKMSLMEFIIHCIRKSHPGLLNFTNDLTSCEIAGKIEMSLLTTKIKEFETGIEKIKKEVAKA